ncbi:MAG: primosomal protein N' [Gammaproteobacteria bacterium]|nr:primosomal protein N' [Gammaproteobacteria bacterium]
MISNNPASCYLVKVAMPLPLRHLFDYQLPLNYPIEPKQGMRVLAPFGKSDRIGIIDSISIVELSDPYLQKVKTITSIIDETSFIPESLIQLYRWLLQYYHGYCGEIWQTMLPTDFLSGQETRIARESVWKISDAGLNALNENLIRSSAVKQKMALTQLAQMPNGLSSQALTAIDISNTTIKALAGKGWVTQEFTTASKQYLVKPESTLELTNEQLTAVEQISKSLDHYQCHLLFGVTASGKTEVYLQLIEQVLNNGRQALFLVPEIGLTPQTVKRFENRFDTEIALLHSGITNKQRFQGWLKAQSGEAKIIIGTRSSIFVPMKNPGIIIIDEEHDLSFRQQQGFRYSARDVALVRGKIEDVPVILGSASPSIETLLNVQRGKVNQLNLKHRAQTTQSLKFRIIDLKQQAMNQGLSVDLVKAIRQHLKERNQVLLFLNRRGYSPVLLCHQCGWSESCSRCDINFTYHHQSHFLNCHHCGSSRRAPTECSNCHSHEMTPVGMGTERLQETVSQLFPQARIARIDRDTTQKKSAMKNYVSAIKSGEVDILIGTQMLAKGHHFPNVTLVALIDMDGALYSADFRATEYAAQLITQVSGRAGRGDKAGEVIIQTHQADHPMLKQIIDQGYHDFANLTINERIETELPPHSYAAMFKAESHQSKDAEQFLMQVKSVLQQNGNSVFLAGPAPAFYFKKAGKYRYQLFLQSNERKQLHTLLQQSITKIDNLKLAKRVRWRLEIDPVGDN